ncbi:hypothetical protein [Carnobacterium inhibens]|uniref:hypothetical protein n=1 Tax=Carnobacterium TaxID=2747 RepID=UPI003D81B7F3
MVVLIVAVFSLLATSVDNCGNSDILSSSYFLYLLLYHTEILLVLLFFLANLTGEKKNRCPMYFFRS